ncbi:MAG: hypothetical protein IKE91_06200 [Clostridia bacterium]|nr:hypothetical protein [Clostridia bacterium]
MGKKKVEMEATSKAYKKYCNYLKLAKKYKIEGAVIDGVKYECMAEAYFEGAADMLHDLYPEKALSKDKWTISL